MYYIPEDTPLSVLVIGIIVMAVIVYLIIPKDGDSRKTCVEYKTEIVEKYDKKIKSQQCIEEIEEIRDNGNWVEVVK